MHEPCVAFSWYRPGAQGVQLRWPAVANVPLAQALQIGSPSRGCERPTWPAAVAQTRDALERGTARLEAGEARLRRARAALDRRAAELGAKLGACEALVAPRAETKPRVGSSRGTWRGPSTDAARTSTSTQVVPERAAAPAPAAAAAAGARVVGVAARPGGAVEARVELAGGAALALELAPDAADARGRLRLRAAHLAHAHVDVADVVAGARREPPPEDVRLVVRVGLVRGDRS